MIASREVEEDKPKTADDVVQEEGTMRSLLTTVLSQLNRSQSLEETMLYLQSEWLSSENDLKIAIQDEATWNALKLPTRLKLAIKSEISRKESAAAAIAAKRKENEERLSNSVPAPLDLGYFSPDDSHVHTISRKEEKSIEHPSTPEDTDEITAASLTRSLRIEVEHKANEMVKDSLQQSESGVEEATYEDSEAYNQYEGYGEEKGLLETIGDDDDDGFRDQVNQKWVKSYSPEHRSVYYFNEITEETTWHLPEGVEVSREDEWATNTWDSSAEHGGSEETESEKAPEHTILNAASTSPFPMPLGPAPTAYTLPIAPPSAPTMPTELAEAFQADPVAVEATPVEFREEGVPAYPVLADEDTSSLESSLDAELEDEVEGEIVDQQSAPVRELIYDSVEDESESVGESSLRAEFSDEGDEDVIVDPNNLQMLMDMGFSEEIAARALQKAHNDMQMATIACLRQEHEEPTAVAVSETTLAVADTGTDGMVSETFSTSRPQRPPSAGKRLPLMSRISRGIDRAMGGVNRAKKRSENMNITLDD